MGMAVAFFIILLFMLFISIVIGLIIGFIAQKIGKQRIITFLILSLLIGITLAAAVAFGFLAWCGDNSLYGCGKGLFSFRFFFTVFSILSIFGLLAMYLGAFIKSLFRKNV